MAVPSVLFLVALMRQGQQPRGKGIERAQASQTRQGERVPQHSGLATAARAPTYGDNGGGKQSIGHHV